MLRRPFTPLSAVSLLLCAATCVLWVRSHSASDVAIYDFSDQRPGTNTVIVSASYGVVRLMYDDHPTALYPPGFRWRSDEPWSYRPTPGWRTLAYERRDQNGGRSWSVYIPHWLAAVLFALPPVLWVRKRRWHRRRARLGLCPACGYDLRATPDRCPECGAAPKGSAA